MMMDSCVAWAPSPTPPRPSSVGIPRLAVKFPSEPPPTDASSSFQPNLFCDLGSLPVKRGYSRAPFHGRTVHAARDFQLAFAIERLERFQLAVDSGGVLHARHAHVERSGRLSRESRLSACPRRSGPTFKVRPRFRSTSLEMAVICLAISTIALSPFSKSSPECAAFPVTVRVYSPTPLRAVFRAPLIP